MVSDKSIIKPICYHCSNYIDQKPKKTFWGFKKYKCSSCGKKIVYPLSGGWIAGYIAFILLFIVLFIYYFSKGGFALPGLAVIGGVYALSRNYFLNKKISEAHKNKRYSEKSSNSMNEKNVLKESIPKSNETLREVCVNCLKAFEKPKSTCPLCGWVHQSSSVSLSNISDLDKSGVLEVIDEIIRIIPDSLLLSRQRKPDASRNEDFRIESDKLNDAPNKSTEDSKSMSQFVRTRIINQCEENFRHGHQSCKIEVSTDGNCGLLGIRVYFDKIPGPQPVAANQAWRLTMGSTFSLALAKVSGEYRCYLR